MYSAILKDLEQHNEEARKVKAFRKKFEVGMSKCCYSCRFLRRYWNAVLNEYDVSCKKLVDETGLKCTPSAFMVCSYFEWAPGKMTAEIMFNNERIEVEPILTCIEHGVEMVHTSKPMATVCCNDPEQNVPIEVPKP